MKDAMLIVSLIPNAYVRPCLTLAWVQGYNSASMSLKLKTATCRPIGVKIHPICNLHMQDMFLNHKSPVVTHFGFLVVLTMPDDENS